MLIETNPNDQISIYLEEAYPNSRVEAKLSCQGPQSFLCRARVVIVRSHHSDTPPSSTCGAGTIETAFRVHSQIRLEGTISLTDELGFEETSSYHRKLAAIIVLCRDHTACLYVNATYRAIIEATIPRLFYRPTVTVTDFS